MTSAISHPKRVSGLSERVAQHRLGVGEARERQLEVDPEHLAPEGRKQALDQLEQLLGVTKASSMSSWVNSAVRSARVASSRKQRAIW